MKKFICISMLGFLFLNSFSTIPTAIAQEKNIIDTADDQAKIEDIKTEESTTIDGVKNSDAGDGGISISKEDSESEESTNSEASISKEAELSDNTSEKSSSEVLPKSDGQSQTQSSSEKHKSMEGVMYGGVKFEFDSAVGELRLISGEVTDAQDFKLNKAAVRSIRFTSPFPSSIPVKTELIGMFEHMPYLERISGLGVLDTSKVKDMSLMFFNDFRLSSIDLEHFDTSSVTNMAWMFGWTSLSSLDLSGFDTSNVTNMKSMFQKAGLDRLDLSSFDTRKVTDMENMFSGTPLKRLVLGQNFRFNTAKSPSLGNPISVLGGNSVTWTRADGTMPNGYTTVEFMKNFGLGKLIAGEYVAEEHPYGANAVYDEGKQKLNIVGGRVSTPSHDGFPDKAPVKTIEFKNSVSVGTNRFRNMFSGFFDLESIIGLDSLKTNTVVDMSFMFKDTKLTSLDLSNFDTTNVTDMNGMFSGLKLQHLTLGDNFKFIGINSDLDIPYFSNGAAGGRWQRADGQSSAYSPADFIKNYGTGELTAGEYVGAQRIFGDAYYTYNEAEHKLNITGGSITNRSDWGNISRADIKSIEFSSPIAVTVTSLSSWLSNLTQLESITGFQNLDTSKVLSMNNMFSKDAALQTLDLSGLNTYNVVSMDYMFADMPSLTSLNLSGFDTKNLRSMAYMFKGLKLQHLILGDYFRFKGEDSKLGVPYSLQGLPGERWRRADGQSSEYSPADFIKNYGTGELTAGEYVAGQRIFGGATYTYDELDGKLVITGGSISNASDWGNIDRTAIKSIEFNTPIPVKTTSLTQWFAFCENLESIVGLSNLNTSGVTEMNGMFMELSKMKTLDLSNFDTSSVISMAQMFANSSIIQLNISGFDANITEMNGMFKGLKLQRLILGEHFKFSGENCELGVPYFTNGNAGLKWRRADGKSSEYSPADFIKNYGTGDLTAGEYVAEKRIFGEASYTYNELEGKLVITGGAISNASDWGNIDRSTIKSIEFNTPIPVTTSSLSGWLSNLTQLESITGLNNLDTSKVTNMKRMFFKDTSLKSLNMSGIDTSNVTDMSSMFSDLTNLTSLDVSNMNTSNVTQMQYMFSYNTALTNLNLSSFDTSNVTDMSYMFYNLRSLRKIDISNFNTINVKNMSHMFLHVHMTHLTLGNKFEFKYDLSNDPSLSVPFLMNGKAAQKWTREDGQSEGYPPVEFMKAYDTGTLTSGTYIAEDKAPQADPVIQIIQLGEKLPDNPRDVLENIVDEDINSLSVSYTKVPDTPKIGYYTAEVELKDSSDQKTLIPISVNVIDKNTTASNLNDFFPVAIHAEDFTVYSDEIEKYINDMQGLNKFIIEKSNAWGWTLEKGDDAIVTVADNGLGQIQIESKPGQYELEIRSSLTNSAMNKITVTVIDSKEQLDVTVPINTEFVSLDTDGGEIKSPMYHITNNSPKDIEVGVNNVEITNNNDNLSLLASSSPDPSSGNNAAKLKLSLESEGKTKVFDLFPGNLAEGLVKASPQEVTDFQIGGKYFGDFEKEKQLGLNVVYSFKIISK